MLKEVKPSAQGMDHLFPQDLKLLNVCALDWLAAMYNIIEQGAEWPKACLQVRTAYLTKPGGDPFKPQDYRNLSITSMVYRLWATARLRDIAPWTDSWKVPGIFAGVPGVGAEDAWYTTNVLLEEAKLTNVPFLGAAADIWKCFDQICRPLLYAMLAYMGLPIGILNAYQSFLDNLVFHNSLAGGLGKPHKRICGIPQGCPLSMLFIAVLFRPWLVMMQGMNIVGRILADDITILGFGQEGHSNFENAYNSTHKYFHDIGARVSTKKCYAFASHAATREWLNMHVWAHLNDRIKVVQHIRDLGGHINTTVAAIATTLNARMQQAGTYARHIRFLPIGDDAKHRLVTTKILALGLYGCEASPANQASLRYLQNSIALIVSAKSSRTSPAISFSTFGHGRDLDPCVHIFTRRGNMFRRMYFKHPDLQTSMHRILTIYTQHNYIGTDCTQDTLTTLWPAPPPLTPHNTYWSPSFQPCGPVGLLLQSCHHNAVAMDQHFCVNAHGEPPISLLFLPQQNVVPALDHIAVRARTWSATTRRTTFGTVQDIDAFVMKEATKKLTEEARRVVRHHYTGGAWANDLLMRIGRSNSSECELCGCPDHRTHFWECEKLAQARHVEGSAFNGIVKDQLHPALQLGLAPEMGAYHLDTFWGDQQREHDNLEDKWLLGRCTEVELKRADEAISLIYKNWLNTDKRLIYPPMQPLHVVQSARQLFARASGYTHQPFDIPDIDTIQDAAPDQPNIYADGASSIPKNLQWSTAALGIYYHDRCAAFTHTEQQLLNCKLLDHQAGEAFAAVQGPKAASTRAELASMIGAALAPYPAHVGMDNSTVVNRTKLLLAGEKIHPYRPWQLLHDGHLWKTLQTLIQQRGAHSLNATWVKGHAKHIHIERNITTELHRECNNKADRIAEQGQDKSHPDGLRRLGQLYRDRQIRYVHLVQHVHKVIYQTHAEATRLRQDIKNQGHHHLMGKKPVQWFLINKQLTWGSPDINIRFHLALLSIVTPTIGGNKQLYSMAWAFLSQIEVTHTAAGMPGVTWIELAALFVARGGSLDLREEGATAATTKTTLPQALNAFRTTIRMIIRANQLPVLTKYFGPSTCSARRLNDIGYDNSTPSVACLPVVTEHEAKAITKFLLSLRCNMKKTTLQRLEAGDLWLPKAKLKLKGAPNWNRFLGNHDDLNNFVEEARAHAQEHTTSIHEGESMQRLLISCHTCGHTKPSSPSKLLAQAKWKYTWCNTCKKTLQLPCGNAPATSNGILVLHTPPGATQ